MSIYYYEPGFSFLLLEDVITSREDRFQSPSIPWPLIFLWIFKIWLISKSIIFGYVSVLLDTAGISTIGFQSSIIRCCGYFLLKQFSGSWAQVSFTRRSDYFMWKTIFRFLVYSFFLWIFTVWFISQSTIFGIRQPPITRYCSSSFFLKTVFGFLIFFLNVSLSCKSVFDWPQLT